MQVLKNEVNNGHRDGESQANIIEGWDLHWCNENNTFEYSLSLDMVFVILKRLNVMLNVSCCHRVGSLIARRECGLLMMKSVGRTKIVIVVLGTVPCHELIKFQGRLSFEVE